jgi:hypothetical protein
MFSHKQHEIVVEMLECILVKENKIMAAIDDLNKAVADVAAAIQEDVADVIAAVAILKNPSSTDAQVETAATALEASAATLKASAVSLEAVLPASPVIVPPVA